MESEGALNLFSQLAFSLFLLFIFQGTLKAQWVNNPAVNTKLVVDADNPINISSIEDLKGGAFILWEDNKNGFQNEVYFLHMDGNGKVSFRADGKRISNNYGSKSGPTAVAALPNTAFVLYKDYSRRKSGDLFVQKVLNNGNYLWNENGIQVTNTDMELNDYSIAADRRGNVYVSYLTRDVNGQNDYRLSLQKINQNGKLQYKQEGVTAYSSANSITQPNIITDSKGGVFLFWLENRDNKSTINAIKIDSTGKSAWGKKPLNISGTAKKVISYSVNATDYSSIYIAWQLQNADKDIYHQLIGTNSKLMWDAGGKLATVQKGDQVNPQVLTEDSTIILSWTNEIEKERNVYIQKYNQQGKAIWKSNGFPVIELKGPQFGQKLISDGKGGAIVSWIDRRADSIKGNIYSQRVSVSGKLAWDTEGIPVASNYNTEKSYLSIISDRRGGAIFIFKERREGKGEIYAQKVFNNGTYISQIIGFTADVVNDSVKVSWYSANEMGETQYDIERTTQSDSSSTGWELIGTIYSEGKTSAKYYEYYDVPNIKGTIYYRVVQSDEKGNFQPSDVTRLNYMESSLDVYVAQNTPNPFDDETTIEFYLPEESSVSFEFFNSRIEEIKKIDNQLFAAGKNKISFSASGLQPGIYFYRFKAGDFVDVKKMVVTKK